MKDSEDILTKDFIKILLQSQDVPIKTIAINLMLQVRGNLPKYFRIHNVGA